MKDSRKKWQAGYGLIEIAIVLVIIGLIMGAVLKGRDLVNKARLNNIIAQIQDIRLKTLEFQERYGFLPGDFPFASRDLHSAAADGQGMGLLQGDPFSSQSSAGLFWVHLYLMAHQPSSYNLTQPITTENGLVISSMGGVFSVRHSPTTDLPGHWIILGERTAQDGLGPLLTPEEAFYLNKKMDNGSPTCGNIRSLDSPHGTNQKCILNGKYNLLSREKACVMYFHLSP